MKYDQTISDLADGLKPVRVLPPLRRRFLIMSCLTYLLVWGLVFMTGDLRGNFIEHLAEPRFLLEFVLGIAVCLVACWGALALSIPNEANLRPLRRYVAVGMLVVLLLLLLYSLTSPAVEPSMLGKRHNCHIETILFGLIPMSLLMFEVRRAAPLYPEFNGILLGIAAFLCPAVAMHVACMYEPFHVITLHYVPALIMALMSGLACSWILRR